jgi:hypothetical protein
MEIQELREKIAESDNPEWFNNLELENPIFQGKIRGLVNIYERIISEKEGWKIYEKLPNKLETSMTFWIALDLAINNFLNHSFKSTHNLPNHWQNITVSLKRNNPNNIHIYSIQEPEILFLLDVFQKNNEYSENFGEV